MTDLLNTQLDMVDISPAQMADAIVYYGEMLGLSNIFWGSPGSAKSKSVLAAAKKRGAYLVDERLGQYDSVDIRGIPDKNDEGFTIWYPASTLPFKGNPRFAHMTDAPIYLFLDEMTMANQAVFGIAYQIADERRCGNNYLMDNVVVIAASNREGDRGIVNRMPTPLCNRMLHFNVILTWEAWCYNWAASSGYTSAPYAIGLLNFKSDLFDRFDPKKPNKAFPTARTWEYALKVDSDPRIPDEFKYLGVAGAIGVGAATEYFGFKETYARTTGMLSAIMADPDTAPVPGEDEPSLAWALAVNISGQLRPPQKVGNKTVDPGNVGPLVRYLERLGTEYMVLAWNLAVSRDDGLLSTPEFFRISKEHRLIYQP